jgi:hypothetical protein
MLQGEVAISLMRRLAEAATSQAASTSPHMAGSSDKSAAAAVRKARDGVTELSERVE